MKTVTGTEGNHANLQTSHTKTCGQSNNPEEIPTNTPTSNLKDRSSPTTISSRSRSRRIEDVGVQESTTNESKIFSASHQETFNTEQRSQKGYEKEPKLIEPDRRRHSNRNKSNDRQNNNNKHGRPREYSPPSYDRRNHKRDFDDKGTRSSSREYGSHKSENTRRQSSRNRESRLRPYPSKRFLTESKYSSSTNEKHRSRSKSK